MRNATADHQARLRRGALATLLVAAAFAVPATAAEGPTRASVRPVLNSGSYFPLRPGYRWVYQTSSGIGSPRTWQVQVLDRSMPMPVMPDRLYHTLVGYFDETPRLVRSDPFGNVFERGADGAQYLWYLLGAPVDTSWKLATAPPEMSCLVGVTLTVGARDEVVTVPAGEFRGVVRIDHSGVRCADAGIIAEWFAPGVGLVRRAETSIMGTVVSDLVLAELGEAVWPRAAYETALHLASPSYVNNLMPPVGPGALPRVQGAMVVRNRSDKPVELLFSGCRSVTLEVRDQAGNVVLETRADDGGCCACDNLIKVTLVRDALVLPFSFTLAGAGETPLPDGPYSLTATLDTAGSDALRPSARSKIEVQSVH